MIIIKGEQAKWLRKISPLIAAMDNDSMNNTETAPLNFKGCGLMLEADEARIWEFLREGVVNLHELNTLGLAMLMDFAEFYDMEFMRIHIKASFFGCNLRTAAKALVHLHSLELNLRAESKLGYIASSAILCGSTESDLVKFLSNKDNGKDLVLTFDFLVEASRMKRFEAYYGFLPILDW